MIGFIRGVMVTLFFLSGYVYATNHLPHLDRSRVCINDEHCFDAYIANTAPFRAKGLMGIDELPKETGMLFIFETNKIPMFWMKGTRIALDILFINQDNVIVHTVKNAQPCADDDCPTYAPPYPIAMVLEINGGMANELGIYIGDRVTYQYGFPQ